MVFVIRNIVLGGREPEDVEGRNIVLEELNGV
jgi:hypothetical protein